MAETNTVAAAANAAISSTLPTSKKAAEKKPKRSGNWRLVKKNWQLYLFVLPALICFALFCYWPMYGVIIAFKDYNPALGFTASPWCDPWYKYFIQFFNSAWFTTVLQNTIVLALYSFVIGNILPLLLALMINEVHNKAYQRTVQMVTYIPYFISVVVLVGIIDQMFSDGGVVNQIFHIFGIPPFSFLQSDAAFKHLYVLSGAWTGTGYGSIIYFAALCNVSPELHEAAIIDGAGRFQRIWHIDIPAIMPTFITLLIIGAGELMNVSYEKVLLMQNPINLQVSEVINTYVYKCGILSDQTSFSTAVGLFNNVINLILLITVNKISKRVSETSLW
jgi:ABC-type polysaccharide transport system, permease component